MTMRPTLNLTRQERVHVMLDHSAVVNDPDIVAPIYTNAPYQRFLRSEDFALSRAVLRQPMAIT